MVDETEVDQLEFYQRIVKSLAESFGLVMKAHQQRFEILAPFSHSAIIIVAGARPDDELGRCLKVTFRDLSNTVEERILQRALQPFAHRIDMAYALRIIDEELFEELRKILAIRNLFAHPLAARLLVAEDVKGLRKYPRAGDDPLQIFMGTVSAINDHLERYLVAKGVTENITAKNLPPAAEEQKSPSS